LEPKEFSKVMREVMAGTNKGKKIISEMIEEIKNELKEDEYNQKMNEDDGLFEIDDLF
jgi:hypothetical protein